MPTAFAFAGLITQLGAANWYVSRNMIVAIMEETEGGDPVEKVLTVMFPRKSVPETEAVPVDPAPGPGETLGELPELGLSR